MKTLIVAGLTMLSACALVRAEDINALVGKGDAYASRLETQKALDSYLAAERIAPPSAELLRRIAKEYAESMADTDSVDRKRELGEKALQYAKEAVAKDPRDALAELSVAVCYGRLAPLLDNRTKVAYSRMVKQYADAALALDPNDDLVYNVLGAWNYEMAGLNPILRGIAEMLYGDLPAASYEEAVKDYKKALELNSGRLANHIGLGRAYAAMGDKARARQELETGLAMPNKEKDDPFDKARGREAMEKL